MKYLFLLVFFISCDKNKIHRRVFRHDKDITREKKERLKQIIYLKDTSVNLCYAVWLDYFWDMQCTCVPCDSVKNQLK